VRPHEALRPSASGEPPAALRTEASGVDPPSASPDHLEIRVISGNGGIGSVYYDNVLLGRLNEEERAVHT
jgi:hypothetical protein